MGVGYAVLAAVIMKSSILWDLTLCSTVNVNPRLPTYLKTNPPNLLPTYLPTYLPTSGSAGLCWTLAAVSVSWSFTQSVGLLGRGISPSQGRYLHTQDSTNTELTHTDINASRGIRTHDPSVSAGEDSSCLRPRGHYDRCQPTFQKKISLRSLGS
jgi:hypothetical protein